MAKLIDGRKLADNILEQVKQTVAKNGWQPGLAIILVGDDQASQVYVRLKKSAAKKVGIMFHEYLMPPTATEKQILEIIRWLNQDNNINAIVLQLPLPKQLNENRLIAQINPLKDADGFHPANLKKMVIGGKVIKPALSQTIMALLAQTDSQLNNKHALIIANSPVFAEPLLYEFKQAGAKALYLSPSDPQLKNQLPQADIVIVAVGRLNFISDQDCKKGSLVIDVGINKVAGHTQGDADPKIYQTTKNIAWISPVPGGVGPVTIALLLKNVLALAQQQNNN